MKSLNSITFSQHFRLTLYENNSEICGHRRTLTYINGCNIAATKYSVEYT